MAVGFLAWDLMVLQERAHHQERCLERIILRDVLNPFNLPHNEFLRSFRVSPALAMDLINLLRPHFRHQRLTAISPEIKVLSTIQFYAHGSYQRPTGNQFNLNISQPTQSRCLHEVTDLINQLLLRQWIQFPMTQRERQVAREKFANAPQPFEGAIGAIDCTFVNILGPTRHEEAFVNHHGIHSLNVQAIVDPDMKVLNINARYPGARNDAFIWNASPIRHAMEYHYNRGERRTWLIGDAGYPLEPWLLTPLPRYPEGTRQYQYTEQPCKTRNVIERFFGVFKAMWRCLSYQRVLMYEPSFAGRIANACATLHNMRIHYRLPMPDYDEAADDHIIANNHERHERAIQGQEDVFRQDPRAVARRIHQQIMRERFPQLRDADED